MATITFDIVFDVPNAQLIVKDTTDYTGYTTDIHGVVYIQGPSSSSSPGTSSSPDITIATADFSPSGQASRQLIVPWTTNWDGLWNLEYEVYPNSGAGTVETAASKSILYDYTTPIPSLSLAISTVASQVTSTDSTDYTSGGAWIEISKTRVHAIYPPLGAVDASGTAIPSPADSGSAATITYTGITTGSWGSELKTNFELQINGNRGGIDFDYKVLDYIGTTAVASVNSSVGLCDVYCCLKALNLRYEEAKCMNKSLAENYKAKIEDVTRLVTLYNQSVDCGLSNDAEVYLTEIKNISECNTECNCYGTGAVPTNIPIASSTSSVSYRLAAGSSNMEISSSGTGTSADPVVYNMDLGASVAGNINYISENLHTTNNDVAAVQTLAQSISNDIDSIEPGINQQVYQISLDTTRHTTTTTQLFATSNVFNSTAVTTFNNKSLSSFDNMNNSLTTSNIYSSTVSNGLFSVTSESNDSSGLHVEITTKTTNGLGAFSFRLLDKETNQLVSNQNLSNYASNINITFRIITQ